MSRVTPRTILASLTLAMTILPAARGAVDPIDAHPAAASLRAIFAQPDALPPTGVTRADYLRLIAGNVDFFKGTQDAQGRIIDPVSKGERQYSTPAFAAAAGVLVRDAGRNDLLEPASRAMSCALAALIEHRAADQHADFYIPLLVHAYRSLKDVVAPDVAARWAEQFRQLDPEKAYRADLRGMNWNVVSSSGELLRRHDGLVAPDRGDAQMAYLEKCLAGHVPTLKMNVGLFEDPGSPMAYDAFSRLWLEDVYADDAYDGKLKQQIGDFLATGGLSTLLLLSPTGEWASGGRSALHNWTDAEVCAICEMNATRWKRLGRDDVAGAFKRAARFAYQSMARWQRPSGELWIIKNRAEPQTRFAYERYSNHSQYNLLPMAMLAIAYGRADDAIAERPTPSEVGGYVFDVRETFHKVAAAAGGYYVLIDTAGDPHYNATGLQRVHRAGVPFPALNDTAAPDRAYEPNDALKRAVALGVQWRTTAGGPWVGLADFAEKGDRAVKSADVETTAATADRAEFAVTYVLAEKGGADRTVIERYALSKDGVRLAATVDGSTAGLRMQGPILTHDGAADLAVRTLPDGYAIDDHGSTTTVRFEGGRPVLGDESLVTHSGRVRQATVDDATSAVVTLEVAPTTREAK